MGRKKEHIFQPCKDCANAHLVEYTGDPLIAECKVNGEKNVASTLLDCPYFMKRNLEPSIEKRKKRIGITDLYI